MYRKHLDKDVNFTQLHKTAHSLLEAPTVEVTCLIHDEIVLCLAEIGERSASK